jgi:hypothetical protein
MRYFISICSIFFLAAGAEISAPALFAKVTGVSDDDVLNVRSAPYYRSEKVGALPPHAVVGVSECRIVKKGSRWCRIYELSQYMYGIRNGGWINARYVTFYDKGYVTIEGREAKCYYAIACRKDVCDVAVDFETDDTGEIVALRTERIDKRLLKAQSAFGAAPENAEGYCTSARMIEAYLRKKTSL